jgi:hypothetical protein
LVLINANEKEINETLYKGYEITGIDNADMDLTKREMKDRMNLLGEIRSKYIKTLGKTC